jgi:hypothetical protein
MSKTNLEREIKKEISQLNEVIDRKIIKGVSYAKEAKRHKFLVSQLNSIHRERAVSSGWFLRSLTSAFVS